jgi:hypothetical protein
MTHTTHAQEDAPGIAPVPSAPGWNDTYPNLTFTRAELAAAMRSTYDELMSFVSQPAFRAVYEQLRALPPSERPNFVNDVLVNREELMRRGVDIPDGILVQTSAFGDRRPTLFAVKKFLPEKFHAAWENVNLTFDNEYADDDVSRDPALAWRKPLPVSLQSRLIAENAKLDDHPDVGRSDPAWSQGLGKTYYTRDI